MNSPYFTGSNPVLITIKKTMGNLKDTITIIFLLLGICLLLIHYLILGTIIGFIGTFLAKEHIKEFLNYLKG
jgi:hypothetical protein